MSSFYSPKGLFPFQRDGIAKLVAGQSLLCVWQTGVGKSMLGLAGSAFLFDEGIADLVLVACESSKVSEWVDDFEQFTKLSVIMYAGTPTKRSKIRDDLAEHQVLVGTYETFRNDLLTVTKERRKKVYSDGPLLEAIGERTKVGFGVFYDESTKVKNRTSANYKAQDRLLRMMRKDHPVWATGLTATPVESSVDDTFNQVRLIAPHVAPKIGDYERSYVRYRDPFGRANYQNLSPNDPYRDQAVRPFTEVIAPVVSFKSKTDPDVAHMFPRVVEEAIHVQLSKQQRDFYEAVSDTVDDMDEDDLSGFTVLRQAAGHPAALLSSQADLSKQIVERVGEEGLRAIGSSKLDVLVERLKPLLNGQDAQVVIFTFFGQSILPLVAQRLREESWSVIEHHGKLSAAQKGEAQHKFRSGKAQVFLSSDAGARGINLPEASYVFNYDLPLTAAGLTQRINRLSRIDAGGAFVNAYHMVASGTIESSIVRMIFRRTDWGGRVLSHVSGEDDRLPSAAQRVLFRYTPS